MTQIITSTNDLATTFKEARLRSGLSQRELAKRSGVGNATISQLEDNSGSNLNLRTLIAISDALDIKLTLEA